MPVFTSTSMRSPPKPAGGEKVKNRVMSAYNQRRSSWASDVDSQIGIGQSPHPAPSPQALLHKALHHHSGGVTSPSAIGDPSQAFNSPAFAPNKPSFGGNTAKPRDGSVVVPQSYVDDLLSAAAARLASPPAAAAGQLGSTRGRAPPPAAVTISHSSSEGVTQASVSRVSTANPSPVHTSDNATPTAAEARKARMQAFDAARRADRDRNAADAAAAEQARAAAAAAAEEARPILRTVREFRVAQYEELRAVDKTIGAASAAQTWDEQVRRSESKAAAAAAQSVAEREMAAATAAAEIARNNAQAERRRADAAAAALVLRQQMAEREEQKLCAQEAAAAEGEAMARQMAAVAQQEAVKARLAREASRQRAEDLAAANRLMEARRQNAAAQEHRHQLELDAWAAAKAAAEDVRVRKAEEEKQARDSAFFESVQRQQRVARNLDAESELRTRRHTDAAIMAERAAAREAEQTKIDANEALRVELAAQQRVKAAILERERESDVRYSNGIYEAAAMERAAEVRVQHQRAAAADQYREDLRAQMREKIRREDAEREEKYREAVSLANAEAARARAVTDAIRAKVNAAASSGLPIGTANRQLTTTVASSPVTVISGSVCNITGIVTSTVRSNGPSPSPSATVRVRVTVRSPAAATNCK